MSFFERYGVAVIAAAVSVGVRMLLNPLFGAEVPFITLYPAVAAAALIAGFRSGLATTVLGAVAVNFFIMSPEYSWGLSSSSQVTQLLLFVFLGGFISWIAGERRRVQSRLRRVETESERRAREAAEALKESEERSRLAQRSVGVGVWEWELATGEVEWSEGVRQLVGIDRENGRAVLEDWIELIIPEDRERAMENVRSAIAAGTGDFYDEFRIRRVSDNAMRWIAVKGRVIREEGRPVRLLGVNYDITESKETELHIQELNSELKKLNSELYRHVRELQTVIDITPVGIAVAKDATCDVIMANPALSRMVGVPPGENISLNRNDLPYRHLKDGRELVADELPMQRAVAERRAVLNEEIEILRPDGEAITIYGYAAPVFDDEGNVISCVAAQIDVTERKRNELERERKLGAEQALRVQAEEANRLKDEFLATVSHELRTPLNSIIGWVAVMRDNAFAGDLTARAVEAIERGARSQSQLIEDLLDVSRIISGKLKLTIAPVDLAAVVGNAVETLRPAADAKNIVLSAAVAPGMPPISGDSDRLQQIVWNLLSNAIKFTPQGGSVDIRVEPTDRDVGISVRDTGKGISSEFLPFVFDRFRQADGSITRTFSGLGLGLAIVRHLVELHGGTVAVESEGENKGSTFEVRLPSAVGLDDLVHMSDQPLAEYPAFDGVRVLVVDDEPDTREILKLTFERCRAAVEEASSADEAFEKVKRWHPEVIVSDIGMPGRDGYTFIEDVRRWETANELKAAPSVALTAYARSEDRARALDSGYHAHVPKPIEPLKIAEIVEQLLGKRS